MTSVDIAYLDARDEATQLRARIDAARNAALVSYSIAVESHDGVWASYTADVLAELDNVVGESVVARAARQRRWLDEAAVLRGEAGDAS